MVEVTFNNENELITIRSLNRHRAITIIWDKEKDCFIVEGTDKKFEVV